MAYESPSVDALKPIKTKVVYLFKKKSKNMETFSKRQKYFILSLVLFVLRASALGLSYAISKEILAFQA